MDYKELLHKMMNECREDAERYLSGDKADYLYCKETRNTATPIRITATVQGCATS